jgi:RND family efflux transporter MFP subunit
MKRIYWVLASITTCLLASCNSSTKDAREYQTVKIDTVTSANGQTYLQYPGKVKAAQDISLAFRVNGTIRKIYVKDGARVQAGQLLAELDPTDYQVQLDATEAEYKQIKAEAERVMALYKENGTTPSANDKAVYGLKQITAKYQHHKDQLGYTRLYAPFNGYIQKRLFEAHETIGAGMPVLSMISGGAPEVEINLPAAEYIRREQFN